MEDTKQAGYDAIQEARGQAQMMSQRILTHTPSSTQFLRIVVFIAGIVAAVAIGGFMLTAVTVTVLLAIPMFLLFSPLLVPLGIIVSLVTGGFLSTEAAVLAITSAFTWLYNYVKGRHPVGADQIDAAKSQFLASAGHVKDVAKDYGSNIISTAREVAPKA